MKLSIKRLSDTLAATDDGGIACDAIIALGKHASTGDVDAKAILVEYMASGRVNHMRDFACSSLAKTVGQSDVELALQYENGLSDDTIRYWSILGYTNILGPGAYENLTKLVHCESLPTEERAHAVKCLSSISQQTFDRQLPDDPGEWEEGDIRLEEIVSWAESGYPDGVGHVLPTRHPALDNPETSLEKTASRLDKRLAKKRSKDQDSANPSNWIAVANKSEVDEITSRWKLPSVYIDFLTRFCPVQVNIASKRFWNGGLRLFGASELIEAQHGYSFNPVKKKAIRSWPKSYLVIASHGGDPFVLDLKASDGNDAPVLTAEHGTGKWEFEKVEESFEAFLRSLVK